MNLTQVLAGGCFTLLVLIAGWGFIIISQNTKAINRLFILFEGKEKEDIGKKELCKEVHKAIDLRLDNIEALKNKRTYKKRVSTNK